LTNVTLVYPYFRPEHDNSIFRLPPLGLGYIVSYLRRHNVSANLVDCTFLGEKEALNKIRESKPEIIGIYSMFSMKYPALRMAKRLKGTCDLLVAGGPLPTLCPEDFLEDFDVVAVGEGEETMRELVDAVETGHPLSTVNGIVYKSQKSDCDVISTSPRELIEDLDTLPFPARDDFDNEAYKRHYFRKSGYTITSLITSRGCPFHCDFCSRAVFGNKFRTRSPENIVDELGTVDKLGYDRIWFSDDCFTLNRNRLLSICDEIIRRKLEIDWECLSRVDSVDEKTAVRMKEAGCVRVFFGLESGNDSVLALMNKQASVSQGKRAVLTFKEAGIEVGAFFIVGYPGETDKTILDTLRVASSLPLDYLSFTMPYPIPGTPLYERLKDRLECDDLEQPKHLSLTEHKLIYKSSFSEAKLKFAILKGTAQFKMRKMMGNEAYRFFGAPFERVTDLTFKFLR
jgi:anaerobic magnesium-protoporphyrin IX monomethyl ester cyclase